MRRREFIALLGGAVAAWPVAARAQQADRMPRIGVLMTTDDAEGQARMRAFLQGLQHLGWVDGRNVRIEARWTVGKADNVRRYVAELAAVATDVIMDTGSASVGRLLQSTLAIEFGAAGWECDRIYPIRVWHQREMAGATQGDRAQCDPRGNPS